MSKTYIHIGYPKNASTTLQTDIFPNIKNSFFLGRSYNTEHSFYSQEISDLMYSITMLDSIDCPLDDLKMKFSDALEAIDQ